MNTTNDTNEQKDEVLHEDGRRYERVSRAPGSYTPAMGGEGKRPRPRITRRQTDNDGGSYQPRAPYQPRNNWQPRPGSSRQYPSQDGDQQYRRQENAGGTQGEGGYGRPNYQPRAGYQPRPRNNQSGEYQPYRQTNYRPRTTQDGREGGYQPAGRRSESGTSYNRNSNAPYGKTGYQNNRRPQNGYRQPGYGNANQQDGYRRPRNNGFAHRPVPNLKKRIDYKEENVNPDEPIRLNKFLANAGACSRREADAFIQAGVVTVNGQVVTELGTKVKRSDDVMFHDQHIRPEKKVYILLNKPKDYVTTVDDPQQRKTVMDLVKDACPERIYPVGRLDRNTTGVLLLTNDGELASKLTHPQYLKKKVYHVFLDKNITAADMKKVAEGVELDDGPVHADAVEYASPTDKKQVGIEIHSGKNRIVRRIFESLGYYVTKLDRVQFCGLTKKNVRRGDWRFLTEKEVDMLRMGAFE